MRKKCGWGSLDDGEEEGNSPRTVTEGPHLGELIGLNVRQPLSVPEVVSRNSLDPKFTH